tara:strand:+ start:169 stop:429 length:261 start_codon:yes stop_codon:yes gene_type:complete
MGTGIFPSSQIKKPIGNLLFFISPRKQFSREINQEYSSPPTRNNKKVQGQSPVNSHQLKENSKSISELINPTGCLAQPFTSHNSGI